MHPRGFRWLHPGPARQAADGNEFVDFSVTAIDTQLAVSSASMALLEFPEDLGRTVRGADPGSIWRWESVKRCLLRAGCTWGALAQDDWGTGYRKPTRFLGRIPGLDGVLHEGPPAFDPAGRYAGPLPRPAGRPQQTLIGKQEDGRFRTAPAAAWPARLCEKFGTLLVSGLVSAR